MIRPGKPILFAKIKQKTIFGFLEIQFHLQHVLDFLFIHILKILNLIIEKPIKAILKNNFIKKKNFTRFIKSKLQYN